ncbi:MAG: ABC transporter ATP-binding protein [Chloroflexi bacterium]|nr:ABC transporter ATP-binding protein [Chloroflexota bacterium]
MTSDAAPRTPPGRSGVVEVVDLRKRFGDVQALAGVSFRLEPGTFYALLGPSGCGKTTLLRLLAGFEQPDQGSILIGDEDVAGVPPYRRPVNTVFQHYALFPHMDVARNVGYGLRQQKPAPGRDEQTRRIDQALELVRLQGFGHRRSWELSGGQQQRVALARAIINRPTVLLLDEPLGALDLKLRREMQVELKQLQGQLGITFIFVTHDQDEAFSMADRVAVMHDGRILQDGPPSAIYDRPADPWVASFIGQMNVLPGQLEELGPPAVMRLDRGPVLHGEPPGTPIGIGERALLAVRPERIWLTRAGRNGTGPEHAGTRFEGRIVRTVFLGDTVEHVVDAPAVGTLVISAPNVEGQGTAGPVMGEEVVVGWTDDAARIISERRPGP